MPNCVMFMISRILRQFEILPAVAKSRAQAENLCMLRHLPVCFSCHCVLGPRNEYKQRTNTRTVPLLSTQHPRCLVLRYSNVLQPWSQCCILGTCDKYLRHSTEQHQEVTTSVKFGSMYEDLKSCNVKCCRAVG